MRPQVGQLINNKYRLVRVIGDGGMGSVFEAQHEVLGSTVALKFLHAELAKRGGLVQRFLQEARVSAKIQSPHVVRVTDVEQTPQGLPFIVMEYLKGQSLQALYEDLYRAGKRLTYEDALEYAMQMLEGLEAAHEEGIVHRDLKPDNVMILKGKRGEPLVKVLDFGIAKLKINGELYKGLTRPGVLMGTPEYMAPEQVFSADAVDARADIFSCGVIFFEMLAGRRPVGGDEPHQIAAQYLAGNFAQLTDLAPHVPAALAAAVHKAMAADPKNRFASVIELRAAIEPFAKEARSGAKPTPATPAGVAASPVAPSPVAASDDARRSVPKTLPPTEDSTAPAQTPATGGEGAIDAASTDKVAEPFRGSEPARTSAGDPVESGFQATEEGQPFFPGATEAYQPIADAPAPQRPGGTAMGGGELPATAGYDAMPSAAAPRVAGPAAYAPMQAAPVAPARHKKGGLGLGSIMMIGLLVTGAVLGSVFAYDQFGRKSSNKRDKDDAGETIPVPTAKPAVPVEGQPSEPIAAPFPTYTPPAPTPTPAPTTPKPAGTTPKPQPTPTPTLPPLMIPSAIPGMPEIPGIPGWGQPAPTTTTPPPAPTSTSTGGGRPKLPPLGSIEPAPGTPSPGTPSPGTTTEPQPAPATTAPVSKPPPKQASRRPIDIRRPRPSATPSSPAPAPSPSTSSKRPSLDRLKRVTQ